MGDSTLMRGGGFVVFLGDFGPVALLGNQLLLGEQVVGEDPILFPNLIGELEFRGSIIAQVSNQLAESGPVLFLYMGVIIFVAWPRPRIRNLVRLAVGQQMRVNESLPLSESMPMMGNGTR